MRVGRHWKVIIGIRLLEGSMLTGLMFENSELQRLIEQLEVEVHNQRQLNSNGMRGYTGGGLVLTKGGAGGGGIVVLCCML